MRNSKESDNEEADTEEAESENDEDFKSIDDAEGEQED